LDKGIENLKQARAQLAVYRQALLKHAFEGHLTADWRSAHKNQLESADQLLARIHSDMLDKSKNHAQDAATNSCGWLKLTLAEITAEALIGLVRASALQNQDGRGFSYVKMDRVDMSGHVDIAPEVFVDCSEEEVKRFALRGDDILFNTRNSVELVGKTGLVRKNPSSPTVFNNNLMRMRTVPAVLPAFLSHQMCAPQFRENMEHVKKATTSVAAVYGKDLWPLPLVVPSTAEQRQIVAELESQLDAVETMTADIDANLQKSEALRQSILKKAFAGELVPQDLADEPAAALLARIRAEREIQAAALKPEKLSPAKK
jgi:type I restriction enzyme S subunit